MVVVSRTHTQSLLLVLTSCAALDQEIDNLVYELYELTPAEIAIRGRRRLNDWHVTNRL